jgi:hypothetical protein
MNGVAAATCKLERNLELDAKRDEQRMKHRGRLWQVAAPAISCDTPLRCRYNQRNDNLMRRYKRMRHTFIQTSLLEESMATILRALYRAGSVFLSVSARHARAMIAPHRHRSLIHRSRRTHLAHLRELAGEIAGGSPRGSAKQQNGKQQSNERSHSHDMRSRGEANTLSINLSE